MRVTLLGTGDSAGTPVPGCDCETCRRAVELGVERSRFSVHVQNEATGESLLVDASPDFRSQFLAHDVPLPDEAIITHVHFDHLDGLGNAYRLLASLSVHAADERDPYTGESVAETVDRRYDYLEQIDVLPHKVGVPFRAAGFDVTLVPVDHPPMATYGVTIEERDLDGEGDEDGDAKLAITGDTSFAIPEASREQLSDADLLLVDGILPAAACEAHPFGGRHESDDGVPRTFGNKHMTREGAIEMAQILRAEDYRIVHLSHRYPAAEAFGDRMAVDGETFVL